MDIILASNNLGKVSEIQSLLENHTVYSLGEVGIDHDTVEDQDTLYGNALKKAREIKEILDADFPGEYAVMAEDSGLFVDYLDGMPGVYSARYAGDHDDEANMAKVLSELDGVSSRGASMVTVAVFIDPAGNETDFVGELPLQIAYEPRGDNGFGYDPILEYEDGRTLAEMTDDEKNSISQRGIAFREVSEYLNRL